MKRPAPSAKLMGLTRINHPVIVAQNINTAFFADLIVLQKAGHKSVPLPHGSEEYAILLLERCGILEALQMLLLSVWIRDAHKAAEQPNPGEQLRMAQPDNACLHGTHG